MNLSAKYKRDSEMNKRLLRDEHGVAHLLLIVLAVVVIGGAAAVAWKVMDGHKAIDVKTTSATGTKTTTTSSSGVSASCLTAYHDNNLCHFAQFADSFNKTAYTAALTIDQSGINTTATFKNDGKGNTELTTTGDDEVLNSISLNGVTYIQTNNSSYWIEYPAGATTPTTNPTSSMNIGVGSSGITFKADGTAACGSLNCYKYQVIDSKTPNATQYVFFDTSSYKLQEWQYTDGSDTTDMTVSYVPVTITAPSPVKPLSSLN